MFSFKNIGDLSFVQGKTFENVRYGFSSRVGGVSSTPWDTLNLAMKTNDSSSNISENWTRFMAALDLKSAPVFYGKQTHGTKIRQITSATKDRSREFDDLKFYEHERFVCAGECDALWTDEPGLAISVFTADCLPVLAVGSGSHPFVAAIHGGWRGLVSKIIHRSLSAIASSIPFSPEEVTLIVGPHIRNCCFEVSSDVAETLEQNCSGSIKPQRDYVGKYLADLGMIVRNDGADFGIPAEQIHVCELCTCCNGDSFYSYRRTRTADRGSMSSVISIV